MSWEPELEELKRREAFAEELGGAERVKRQKDGGRLTIRERVEAVACENRAVAGLVPHGMVEPEPAPENGGEPGAAGRAPGGQVRERVVGHGGEVMGPPGSARAAPPLNMHTSSCSAGPARSKPNQMFAGRVYAPVKKRKPRTRAAARGGA